ncbi:MAG TPA: hypothetical protein VEB70_10075 [Noviherbaspirillum sp.]|nr:hypothetical protein [Noviherbaspirillum sp.]
MKEGVTVAEVEQAFGSVAAEDKRKPVGTQAISDELQARSTGRRSG